MQEGLCLGTILSAVSYFSFRTIQNFNEEKKQMNHLKFSKKLTPAELPQIFPIWQQNPNNQNEYTLTNTLIEGILDSKAPFKSFFSEKNLLYQEVRRYPLYSNQYLFQGHHGTWTHNIKSQPCQTLSMKNPNLELYSFSDDKKATPCLISRNSIEIPQDILEEIGSNNIKLPNLSVLENFSVLFNLLFESIFFFYLPRNVLNGAFIGYSDREVGIRAGGFFSLVGDLVYNTDNKTFSLKNAQFLETAIEKLKNKMVWTKWKLVGLGLTGLLASLYYFRKYLKKSGTQALRKLRKQSVNRKI